MKNNRYFLYFSLLMIGFITPSCKGSKKQICLHEFRHVVEEYDPKSDGYNYYYSDDLLDSIEVMVLKELLDQREIEYYVSNQGRIFHTGDLILGVESASVIDDDLIDTIVSRNLPTSRFVQDRIKKRYND